MMRIKGPLVQKEAWVRRITEMLAFIARRGEGTPPYEVMRSPFVCRAACPQAAAYNDLSSVATASISLPPHHLVTTPPSPAATPPITQGRLWGALYDGNVCVHRQGEYPKGTRSAALHRAGRPPLRKCGGCRAVNGGRGRTPPLRIFAAPVAFVARRGEGTPPYGGEQSYTQRRGSVSPPVQDKSIVNHEGGQSPSPADFTALFVFIGRFRPSGYLPVYRSLPIDPVSAHRPGS